MDLNGQLDESAAIIRKAMGDLNPTVGIVLGSGLGGLAERIESVVRIPYAEVPHMAECTGFGHEGCFVCGVLGGKAVIAMKGRLHGYEGHSPSTVVYPIRVLSRLGVTTLVESNASGAVNASFRVGDLCCVTDHCNLTGRNPLADPDAASLAIRSFSMTDAYDPILRQKMHEVADSCGIVLRDGVYAGLLGPSFETPAEIRMLRIIGCDLVGMSTVEEVIAARHLGMRVVAVSLVSNMAAGIEGASPSLADIDDASAARGEAFQTLVEGFVATV